MHEATVFLLDDDEAVRDALSVSLRHAGFRVEPYSSGPSFLNAFDGDRPGCLLLDLCMPEMDGLSVQQELIARDVRLPVVFMTAHGTIRDSVSALKAGAVDFLEKPFSRTELLECVGEALARDARMRGCLTATSTVKAHYDRLSPREREIMALIASGKSSKQIGATLGISPRTVDAHRARLMVKMQASSLAELGAMSTVCQETAGSVPREES